MRLLSQMNDGQAWSLSVHSPIRGTRTDPALSRERARWKSVLLDQRPSLLTLRRRAFRLCSNDSSVICRCPTPRRRARAVRPKPSPAVLRLTFAAGISEVSRFSCMKFLGVPGAFDYAGPTRARAIAIVRVAFRTCLLRRRPGCIFSQLNLPPRLFPCLRFAVHLAMPNAKLGAKVDRYSFFVRLLPPLLHTGLARRTNNAHWGDAGGRPRWRSSFLGDPGTNFLWKFTGNIHRRSRGGGKSEHPAAVAGCSSAVGKSCLWTFPRNGFFHGPSYSPMLQRAVNTEGERHDQEAIPAHARAGHPQTFRRPA